MPCIRKTRFDQDYFLFKQQQNKVILKENYKMSDICKDREALRPKYEQFIQTERGKEWKYFWQSQTGSERSGDFGDYLYDFYPEMLQ